MLMENVTEQGSDAISDAYAVIASGFKVVY